MVADVCKVVHCIFVWIKIENKLTPCRKINRNIYLNQSLTEGKCITAFRVTFSHEFRLKTITSAQGFSIRHCSFPRVTFITYLEGNAVRLLLILLLALQNPLPQFSALLQFVASSEVSKVLSRTHVNITLNNGHPNRVN